MAGNEKNKEEIKRKKQQHCLALAATLYVSIRHVANSAVLHST